MKNIQKIKGYFFNPPWRTRITFKHVNDCINEGYVYGVSIDGMEYFVSQNRTWKTVGLAQNWIVHENETMSIIID